MRQVVCSESSAARRSGLGDPRSGIPLEPSHSGTDARKALGIVEKLPKNAHTHEVGNITLGLILNKTGRTAEAEPLLRETLEIVKQSSRRPLDVALASAALGECLAIQKRYAEAEPLLIQSYDI